MRSAATRSNVPAKTPRARNSARSVSEAANTIAFGLMVDWETDDSNILRYTCGYPMLTGRDAPHSQLYDCTGYSAS